MQLLAPLTQLAHSMKKTLFAVILILSIILPSTVSAQSTPTVQQCINAGYNTNRWRSLGCNDDIRAQICIRFVQQYGEFAPDHPEWDAFGCRNAGVDFVDYVLNPDGADQCGTITSQNYDRCCKDNSVFVSGFEFEQSQQCKDYLKSLGTTPQNLICSTPGLTNQQRLDAGCDKAQLIQNGTLQQVCSSLDPSSNRYRNLGCGDTPAAIAAGQASSLSSSQVSSNASEDVIVGNDRGMVPRSSAKELASCSEIRFVSLLDIIIWVKCIIVSALIPLIFALAFLFFLWGILRFMAATDQKKREESKKFIWWGIIGLFVMVSIWGIIKIIGNTLGTGSAVPHLQTDYLNTQNANRKR